MNQPISQQAKSTLLREVQRVIDNCCDYDTSVKAIDLKLKILQQDSYEEPAK